MAGGKQWLQHLFTHPAEARPWGREGSVEEVGGVTEKSIPEQR